MRPLSLRERRVLALGLLAAAIIVVVLGVAAPIALGFSARQDEREALLTSFQRNSRVIGSARTWREQADRQRASAGRFAVRAPAPAGATELLRERLINVLAQEGGVVKSVQETPVEGASDVVRIRADLEVTLAQLHDGLRRLQNEEPYVVVEYLSVAADRAFQTGHLAPMDVRLEVSARYQPSPAGQP